MPWCCRTPGRVGRSEPPPCRGCFETLGAASPAAPSTQLLRDGALRPALEWCFRATGALAVSSRSTPPVRLRPTLTGGSNLTKCACYCGSCVTVPNDSWLDRAETERGAVQRLSSTRSPVLRAIPQISGTGYMAGSGSCQDYLVAAICIERSSELSSAGVKRIEPSPNATPNLKVVLQSSAAHPILLSKAVPSPRPTPTVQREQPVSARVEARRRQLRFLVRFAATRNSVFLAQSRSCLAAHFVLHDCRSVRLAGSLIVKAGLAIRRALSDGRPSKVSDPDATLEGSALASAVAGLERPCVTLLVRFVELCCETEHSRPIQLFRDGHRCRLCIVEVVHPVQRLDANLIRFRLQTRRGLTWSAGAAHLERTVLSVLNQRPSPVGK